MNHVIKEYCPFCGEQEMQEETFAQQIRAGRTTLSVTGLLHQKCKACASVVTTADQLDHNAAIIRAAEERKSAYVTPGMLREFRLKYGISQRQASQLVGSGASSFGRYESGGKLSKPTAKLIRVALAFPAVARFLAKEEFISLKDFDLSEWYDSIDDLLQSAPLNASAIAQTQAAANDDFSLAQNWKMFRSPTLECA